MSIIEPSSDLYSSSNKSPNSSTTMPSHTSKLLITSCLLHYLLIPIAIAQPPFFYCYPGDYNYTQGDQFQSNLNTTLKKLPSNIDNTSNGYYYTDLGDTTDNKVYVLLQCRGDVSTKDCQVCAAQPARDLPKLCRIEKQAAIFYDECLVHYADYDFAANENGAPTFALYDESQDGSLDPVGFSGQLKILIDNLSSTAVAIPSKFALGKTRLRGSKNIYGLVQCTRGMSGDSCSICLTGITGFISRCCYGKEPGWVMTASCYLRYNNSSFFKTSLQPPFVTAPASTAPTHGSSTTSNGKTKYKTIIVMVVPTVIASLLIFAIFTYLLRRKNQRKRYRAYEDGVKGAESLVYDLSILRNATNEFSESEKLGQGGFGAVYKGILLNGREVAVKRLSQKSRQGIEELKVEVVLLAKLQHKNLVTNIFYLDPTDGERRLTLDWDIRYKILIGIAEGLLYLHQDSQVRIIHRDIKASNILLDSGMNPKISDFGLAKIFYESEAQVNTLHPAGTLGYMAPEYTKHGHFSIKSDVFSFGILVLEIVAGTRNKGFRTSANLQSYAWESLRNGTWFEMADPAMGGICDESQLRKCIHVGLLCVERDPADRPTMSEVLVLLNGDTISIPVPSQPAYFMRTAIKGSALGHLPDINSFAVSNESRTRTSQRSLNYLSISDIDPR